MVVEHIVRRKMSGDVTIVAKDEAELSSMKSKYKIEVLLGIVKVDIRDVEDDESIMEALVKKIRDPEAYIAIDVLRCLHEYGSDEEHKKITAKRCTKNLMDVMMSNFSIDFKEGSNTYNCRTMLAAMELLGKVVDEVIELFLIMDGWYTPKEVMQRISNVFETCWFGVKKKELRDS